MDFHIAFQIGLSIVMCIALGIIIGKLYKKNNDEARIEKDLEIFKNDLKRIEGSFQEDMARNRHELMENMRLSREELNKVLKNFETAFTSSVDKFKNEQQIEFEKLINKQNMINESTESRLSKLRDNIDMKLTSIQEGNEKKLEEMRVTVDEKLQESVEKRFDSSFKVISDRLEQVHKGLGEMQNLASGVGDLKKILTNVKTRGTLGEIQLGTILEEVLSPEQYEHNAQIKKNSAERVEFAVRLPGKDDDGNAVLLPIDSKFPIDDYQRLLDAYETANDPSEIERIAKAFEAVVKKNGKDIHDKYIDPPRSTDFAIMFVPTEGLYSEILRRPALFENLQRDYKITVVGPTNLVAFLSSLQMGFRTLAIEKRSSEVWKVLGAIKTEFGKFDNILEKVQKKLGEATNTVESAKVRTRAISRKLNTVEELPVEESVELIGGFEEDYDEE